MPASSSLCTLVTLQEINKKIVSKFVCSTIFISMLTCWSHRRRRHHHQITSPLAIVILLKPNQVLSGFAFLLQKNNKNVLLGRRLSFGFLQRVKWF